MTLKAALRGGMLVLAGATAGCIPLMPLSQYVQYTMVNQSPRPLVRRAPDSVDVFLGRRPERPHVDVGLFEVRRDLDGTSYGYYHRPVGDAVASLRLHGALRGCDAVAVLDFDPSRRYDDSIVRGICAMYTDTQAVETKVAPLAPLPGEGKSCSVATDPYGSPSLISQNAYGPSPVVAQGGCTDPLTCVNQRCVSPYH